jgi:hypothetical protein
MSTFIHLMPQTLEAEVDPVASVRAQPQEIDSATEAGWDMESFADEQIRGLVRNVYLSRSKPSPQVVFAAVDRESNLSGLCRRIGQTLSVQVSGSVCLVDLQETGAAAEREQFSISSDHKRFGRLRDCSLQLSSRLWYMPGEVFLGAQSTGFSTAWLRSRLAELRLEFDYLVIQAPAAGATNQAAMIARACDGLVLIVEANSTRRASALKVKEMLDAAHVRLLGTVLSARTFPIPHAIYQRV